MPIDFNTLVQLSKIISQLNENTVRIEQNLLQKDFLEKTTQSKSYTVQLGDSKLILSKTHNPNYLEGQQNQFFEQQRKAYNQIMSLDSSDFERSIRGGFLPVNMDTLGRRLSQEYKEYQDQYNSPPISDRFDTKDYDSARFMQLSQDPHAKVEVYHKKTVDEARSAIQAEILGFINGVNILPKPYCQSVDLDFVISGPSPFTHMDIKHPVGSAILKKQKQNVTLRQASSDLGKTISRQKKYFCGLEQGPKNRKNVLHIVDLCYVPAHEKEIVKEFCTRGADSSEGILFLNT
jgi:hypothetical protein